MTAETRTVSGGAAGFRSDFDEFWRGLPEKRLFFGLLAAWVALFHFLGNATFGYTNTTSLFGWLINCYTNAPDDEHGFIIPLIVLALFWMKHDELLAVPKRHWWPGVALLIFALLLHVGGFMVQQTRISVIAFIVGLYALMGLTWGPRWLRASFFPFFLLFLCVPLSAVADTITVPLRLFATTITSFICHIVLGIDVIQEGNRLLNANGTYQYEVAAACSGIRSLTAIFALTTIYGFTAFRSSWRTLVVIGSSFPLAVGSNVLRLISIIIASEVFNPATGRYIHESGWISLLPYIPAMIAMLVLGYLLRENRLPPQPASEEIAPAAQNS